MCTLKLVSSIQCTMYMNETKITVHMKQSGNDLTPHRTDGGGVKLAIKSRVCFPSLCAQLRNLSIIPPQVRPWGAQVSSSFLPKCCR